MGGFVGGKNGAGVYQRIISLIPPHRTYIEPFAGTAAVLRHKRPAARSLSDWAVRGSTSSKPGSDSASPHSA